jgi:hypothetical protein
MDKRKHIYYLTVSDVQTVAQEILERELTEKELTRVVDKLPDKIQWYDAIEEVITRETAAH